MDTSVARLAVDICPAKFAVETKPDRFAVLTNPPRLGMLERYPVVPRPVTVLVRFACVKKLTPTIRLVDIIGA